MTTKEWIEAVEFAWPILAGVAGIIYGWIQRRYKLPKSVIWTVKTLQGAGVSMASIDEVLRVAGTMTSATNDERRAFVAEKLQGIAGANGIKQRPGIDEDGNDILLPGLPDSAVNLIVEWAYGRLKARTK